MKEVRHYCVTLKSLGRITQLPDSQQIFGALVYMLSDMRDSETASDFVKKVKNYEGQFTLSNLLPKGYFPVPQSYLKSKIEGDKPTYKAIKKRMFLKQEHLLNVCKDTKKVKDVFPYVYFETKVQIHAAIDSLRYDLPGLSPNVYSTPEVTVIEVTGDQSQNIITEFDFYFSIVGENLLLECLEKAHESEYVFTLGPRSSQGLNLYGITEIRKAAVPISQTAHFLNLGRMLPQKQVVNFKDSFLDLFTSERRPFHSWGERNDHTKAQYISFLDSGSLISLENEKAIYQAGTSAPSPFDPAKGIVFGQSFLYPVEIEGSQDE
jgi:CRISPR type III-A-associated RAMP protein Csm4